MGNLARGLNKYGINHGPYQRDDFASKVKEIRPSFIGIFSIWPETYCHTLSEAWNTGVPILTTRMGAQEERLNKNGGGWFINHLNPEDAYDEIIRISESPEEYLKVAEQVSKINFRSTREMAEDYKNLYEKILNQ
jgi:glycosyltransferase involved in cell wall biosynthesis